MKSILVFADNGPAMAARTEAALDVARAHKAHVTFMMTTPYSSYVAMDPMGGVYMTSASLEAIREDEGKLEAQITEEMQNEDISYDIARYSGDPVKAALDASRLADLIIVSLGSAEEGRKPHILLNVGELVANSRCPVLAVPDVDSSFNALGTAAIAWNGSHEAGNAVRAVMPMLKLAKGVNIITVDEKPQEFPATSLAKYLSRHGIHAELHQRERGNLSIEEVLENAADSVGADWLVMGAYGHSRWRENLLGGVTKYFLDDSDIPLVLAH